MNEDHATRVFIVDDAVSIARQGRWNLLMLIRALQSKGIDLIGPSEVASLEEPSIEHVKEAIRQREYTHTVPELTCTSDRLKRGKGEKRRNRADRWR